MATHAGIDPRIDMGNEPVIATDDAANEWLFNIERLGGQTEVKLGLGER